MASSNYTVTLTTSSTAYTDTYSLLLRRSDGIASLPKRVQDMLTKLIASKQFSAEQLIEWKEEFDLIDLSTQEGLSSAIESLSFLICCMIRPQFMKTIGQTAKQEQLLLFEDEIKTLLTNLIPSDSSVDQIVKECEKLFDQGDLFLEEALQKEINLQDRLEEQSRLEGEVHRIATEVFTSGKATMQATNQERKEKSKDTSTTLDRFEELIDQMQSELAEGLKILQAERQEVANERERILKNVKEAMSK